VKKNTCAGSELNTNLKGNSHSLYPAIPAHQREKTLKIKEKTGS
jgi:hypothetical protein